VSQSPPPEAHDFRDLYEKHVDFVWLTLQRLGVRPGDRDDLCHDVFLVAFKKLDTYAERAAARRWLFAISVRLAANHRRRAHVRLERSVGAFDGAEAPAPQVAESSWPDAALGRQEAFERVHVILQRMQPLQRVVFVMFEVEGTPCEAIATELGVALGTEYSRLHAARKTFRAEAERLSKLPKPQGRSDE
jgi:RNA polymerase sigma-70 factor (ECF subfamily)